MDREGPSRLPAELNEDRNAPVLKFFSFFHAGA